MANDVAIIRPQAGFQEMFVRSNVDFCMGGGCLNSGKLQPVDSNVLTPTGWVRMGDLRVGDYVSTPFGKPSKVIEIYEHKQKDIYRITTNDGRSCECGLEHLWSIRTQKQKQKFLKERDPSKYITVLETSDLIKRLANGKKNYIQIPYAQEFPKKELVIPPYVLGVLLGDGCMTPKTWINNTNILFSSQEEDIIQKVYDIVGGTKIYRQPNCYTKKIYTPNAKRYREYCESKNLMTYSHLKYIPDEYLFSSIEDRKQLLFGLMDTDGTVSTGGNFIFSTTSEEMKNGFVFLCRSLGYRATVHKDSRDKYKSGVGYSIIISTFDNIFTSKKHIERYNRWINKDRKYERFYEHIYITSIERVRVSDARCILVDDPLHLYITDDFITTHNSYASVLACSYGVLDPKFTALYLRNNLGDLKAGGGIADTFREIFGENVNIVESGEPHIDFPSGARIDLTHVNDQSRDAIRRRFKGRQYDLIVFDEGTGYTWECFTEIATRNRGKGNCKKQMLMTTNPEKDHWIRTFIDWYVGDDGLIREDRNGVIRYFYVNGETVSDVVWGFSKEEVISKCRVGIEKKIKEMNKKSKGFKFKAEDLVKSFTFYLGSMSENVASIGENGGYAGSVAMVGGRAADQYLEGNWNVSTKGVEDAPIPQNLAAYVFENDPQTNGDKWLTVDLADYGTDNYLAIAWDGFHIIDIQLVPVSTPIGNAYNAKSLCAKHGIREDHVIFDATSGMYFKDYLPTSIAYYSNSPSIGVYGKSVMKLKDECFDRLCSIIGRRQMSIAEHLHNLPYVHAKIKERISIKQEFLEECAVVLFREAPGGRKTLVSKKEMRKLLGRMRSTDFLDPCAMRMLPVLRYSHGQELECTAQAVKNAFASDEGNTVDIYDESTWC